MAKSKGPYFEFYIQRNGGGFEFVFAPGNSSKQIFNETKKALIRLFNNQYGVSSKDLVREVNLEDGTPSIAIYQSKALQVFLTILDSKAFSDFKIRFKGIDNNGQPVEETLINPEQAQVAKKGIPYWNKNNNDLTTKRRK